MYLTSYNMFKFVAFVITLVTCIGGVAASPGSAPQARAQPGPTGFNMFVVSTYISTFKFILFQHEPWYQRLRVPSWFRDLHSEQ